MSTEVVGPRSQSGFMTLWNLVVAPSSACAALRERPTWVVAVLLTAVATGVTALIMQPAVTHMLASYIPGQMASDPRYAGMTTDERARAVALALSFARFGWISTIVIVLVVTVVMALILLVATALGRGTVSFVRQFALAANVVALWYGIGESARAAIVAARGPDALANPLELNLALPCLAWLVPGAAPKVAGFLAGITPFAIWAFFLLGLGMTIVSRVSRPVAFGAAAVVVAGECFLLAQSAR